MVVQSKVAQSHLSWNGCPKGLAERTITINKTSPFVARGDGGSDHYV